MPKRQTKIKTVTNVFSINDRRPIEPQPAPQGDQVSYSLTTNVYGFAVGDLIICETNFEVGKLKMSSLVVGEKRDRRNLMTCAEAQAIEAQVIAVVVAFKREINH